MKKDLLITQEVFQQGYQDSNLELAWLRPAYGIASNVRERLILKGNLNNYKINPLS